MKNIEFLKLRKELNKKISAFQKLIEKEHAKFDASISRRFVKANSPVETFKVYKPVTGAKAPRGFSRFVVYTQQVRVLGNKLIFITVGGWWLDKDSVPSKWAAHTVYGVGNPAVFELDENQTHQKHPEAKN